MILIMEKLIGLLRLRLTINKAKNKKPHNERIKYR